MNDDLLLGGGNIPQIGGKTDPRNYDTVRCDKCGGIVFDNKTILKKVSGVEVGQGSKPIFIPLPILVCAKCGAILADDIRGYKLEKDLEKSETEFKL